MLRTLMMATAKAALLSLVIPLSPVWGQNSTIITSTPSGPSGGAGAVSEMSSRSGLLLDHLSARKLETWKSIEELVFAEDKEKQPLHPTLRSMWEWIETSGHKVYVEFMDSKRSSTSTAGVFSIDKVDPRGESHSSVIRLNLFNIDHAAMPEIAGEKGGFIPFSELSGEERYAEVLGHEMAHAIYILSNPERTSKIFDNVETTNQILLLSNVDRSRDQLRSDINMMKRITKRDEILRQLEAVAESMEKQVWKELVKSKAIRKKMAGDANRSAFDGKR